MGYFPVRYDSRVVNYDRKMFIRLATGHLASLDHRAAVLHVEDALRVRDSDQKWRQVQAFDLVVAEAVQVEDQWAPVPSAVDLLQVEDAVINPPAKKRFAIGRSDLKTDLIIHLSLILTSCVCRKWDLTKRWGFISESGLFRFCRGYTVLPRMIHMAWGFKNAL